MANKTMPTDRLPPHVRISHGAYYYVRRDPATKRVVWRPLGKSYPQMLRAVANLHEDPHVLMCDVLERYRREISSAQSCNTKRQRDWQLDNLIHSFGEMPPSSVTPQHVYRYLDERTQTAPVGANREVSLLCAVFTKAVRWGYIAANPARGIEKNKERPRRRYVTDAEYQVLLAHANGHVRRGIELAYLTGQRVGDLLRLQWREVHADGIHVLQAKTGTALVIEPSPALNDLLKRCRAGRVQGQTILADERGQPLSYWRLAGRFRRMVQTLVAQGLLTEHVTFHDLRRKAGSDTDENSKLLGHLDRRTLQRVYRVKPERAKPPR